jgi:hypothetical protein
MNSIGTLCSLPDPCEHWHVFRKTPTRHPHRHHRCRGEKFDVEFSSRLFLEQLVFLEDVEATEIQFLRTAVTRSAPLGFFEANIRANAERI